jgi:hypothetical protein
MFDALLASGLPSWLGASQLVNSATHGNGVSALCWLGIATRLRPSQPTHLPTLPSVFPLFAPSLLISFAPTYVPPHDG